MMDRVTVSVKVSNLGPLRSAEAELADLTLFVGENNTGKTFFATVLSRVLGASPVSSSMSPVFRPHLAVPPSIPGQLRDWLLHLYREFESHRRGPVAPWIRPTAETLDWARRSTTAYLESFGTDVRDNVEYAFGVEATELRRRARGHPSPDCYVRVRNTDPTWEVEVRFDSNRVTVVPPDAHASLRQICEIYRFFHSRELGRSGLESPYMSSPETMPRFVRRDIQREWISRLYDGWPIRTVHLPAGRTGIMQSYKVIAGAVVRQSAAAGIRPIEIDPLPGTAADFLSILLEPDRGPRGLRPLKKPTTNEHISLLIQELEGTLGASIRRDRSAELGDMVVAITREGKFPLSRTSSMLSELAPVLLVLKGRIDMGDHITIDEPEAHLHPSIQRVIASFVTKLVTGGIQILITTHSDFFIGQINNAIRSGKLSKSAERVYEDSTKVCALQFTRDERSCIGRPLDIDPVGGIDESTFTEVMSDLYDESADLIDKLLELNP